MSRATPATTVATARELPPGLTQKFDVYAPGANRKLNGTRGWTLLTEVGGNTKHNFDGTQYACKRNTNQ